MATSDTVEIVRVPTLVRYLRMDVLEELSFKLNPRHNMKDFRYLAGLMNYNYGMVKNLERQKNPTTYLLSEWDMSHAANGEAKTVGDLIELLKQMKRDDAVEILRPFEFTDVLPKPALNNLNSGSNIPHDLSGVRPVGLLFGEYASGDLNEKRPAQENEYPYNGNLYSSGIFDNCIGDDERSRPNYQEFLSNIGSPMTSELRPQAQSYPLQNGLPHGEINRTMQPPHTPPSFPPEVPSRPGFRPYQEFLANIQHTVIHNIGSPLASEPRPPVRSSNLQNGSLHDVANGTIKATHVQPSFIPEIPSRPAVSDKVALVIGNQQYECEKLQGLVYSEKDAFDVTQALSELGFKVVSLVNLSLSEMRIAVLTFCRLLGKGVYGVLYYAGHGYEDSGKNYLLPVDSDLKYNRQDSLCAQEILETMQTCETALNLLIIDACRLRMPTNRGSVENEFKRGRRGNNIFAYSCCTQHEAYEEPGQSNGLYALHLLRHIRRDERIERILMDVARDVSMASNRNLIQRPCHESDAVLDCRLADKFSPSNLPEEYEERRDLWMHAHCLPKVIPPIRKDGIVISFEYIKLFSNVLEVRIEATNATPFARHEVVMDFSVPTPVKADLCHISGDFLAENGGILRQRVRLSRLQKLQDPIEVTFKMMYTIDEEVIDWQVPVRLGCPLVSSVFVQWDWWITCGRLPGLKCTQV
ncbi:mucosa-associated lymphoid tissue lymphoma translocation protein 1 homolog [Montipora capricornis]|uniref:mucosa-associated lymphoid tissue lymphoma translocation protein 1 homolog n=1 Tax=Montipora foliosa TaxID=591990 RepID=UPI0035F1B1CA